MSFASQIISRRRNFWTPARVAFSFAAFALIVAFTSSSCSRSTNVGNTNEAAKSPAVTVTSNAPANSTAATKANNGAPNISGAGAATSALPASILGAEFKGLDGQPIKLSDYAGKVLVVDMWATWCPPCREEIPHLVEVSKQYAGRGVEVIGLDIDPAQDDAETVRNFAKQFKVNYKIGWAEQDIALALMNGEGSIPQTLVISRDGRVLAHFRGYSAALTPGKMNAAIDEAVKDTSGT